MAAAKPIAVDDGDEIRVAVIAASRALADARMRVLAVRPDVARKLAEAGHLVGSAIRDLIAGPRSAS